MKNKESSTRGKPGPRISDTVIVAILGLVGTVIVALIGVWGIFVQNKPPSAPTQTAEVEPTPTIQKENPNVFSDVVIVTARPECGTPYALPGYIDPFQGFDQAMAAVNEAFNRGDIFPHVPRIFSYPDGEFIPDGNVIYQVTVESHAPLDWIKVDKKAKITIAAQKIPADPVNTIDYQEGCGGTGEERDFHLDRNLLETSYPSYTLDAAYENENVDYFTLQPGEFETFLFTLQCGEPGLYNLQFQIPMEYEGKPGFVSADGGEILCPPGGAHWDPSRLIGGFKWDGSQYIPDQP